jgi:hypothetical protein
LGASHRANKERGGVRRGEYERPSFDSKHHIENDLLLVFQKRRIRLDTKSKCQYDSEVRWRKQLNLAQNIQTRYSDIHYRLSSTCPRTLVEFNTMPASLLKLSNGSLTMPYGLRNLRWENVVKARH